jgi:hypothetical protein
MSRSGRLPSAPGSRRKRPEPPPEGLSPPMRGDDPWRGRERPNQRPEGGFGAAHWRGSGVPGTGGRRRADALSQRC